MQREYLIEAVDRWLLDLTRFGYSEAELRPEVEALTAVASRRR